MYDISQAQAQSRAMFFERRDARRLGNSIGAAMLFFTAISFLYGIALGVYFLFFDVPGWYNLPSANYLINAILTAIGFVFPFMLAVVFARSRISVIFAAKPVRPGLFFSLAALGIGVAAPANYAASMISNIISLTGKPAVNPEFASPEGVLGFLLVILSGAAMPALVEEFAFRGVVLGLLRRSFGDAPAIFLSAAFFGFMHGNFVQIPFAFLLGLIFGYIDIAADSIWPSVLAHFAINASAFALDFFEETLSPTSVTITNIAYMLIMLAIGFIGFVFYFKSGQSRPLRPTPGPATAKQKVKWFFSAPCIIIYLVLGGIELLLTQLFY